MIRYIEKTPRTLDAVELPAYKPGAWVYVEAPNERDVNQLVAQFKLDKGLIPDALDENEIPRLEQIGDTSYIFVRFAYKTKGKDLKTTPLLFVLRSNLLVTVSHVRLPSLEVFLNGDIDYTTASRAKLILQILEQIGTHYDNFVESIDRQIKRIRSRLREREISSQDFIDFATIEDDLNEFLSALLPTNATLRRLTYGRYMPIFEEYQDIVEDLLLNNEQSVEACNANMKSIANIRAAYSLISSHNLDRTIKVLTVATVMIAIPNLFYGMYGMNVGLPLQHEPWAYGGLTLFTFLLVLVVYLIGRHRKIF